MVVGLYYELQVDYATQLWQDFGNSIAHTNVVNGVSFACYWSLILWYVSEKEGILHDDVLKAEFVFLSTTKDSGG